jgi:anti-sigma factor RsiW
MHEISDEQLMAYADGELADAESRLVETYLSEHPDGNRRLDVFIQTRNELRTVFSQPLYEPVPDRLLHAVLHAPMSTSGVKPRQTLAKSWNLSSFLETLWTPLRPVPLAAAFGVALTLGSVAGWTWHSMTARSDGAGQLVAVNGGRVIASGALQRSLETAQSGSTVALQAGGERLVMTPVATFERQGGGHCRQYELQPTVGQKTSGIGCRNSSGEWLLELQVVGGAVANASDRVVPAGRSSSPLLEGFVDRTIKGDVLGRADELDLIKQKWRLTSP